MALTHGALDSGNRPRYEQGPDGATAEPQVPRAAPAGQGTAAARAVVDGAGRSRRAPRAAAGVGAPSGRAVVVGRAIGGRQRADAGAAPAGPCGPTGHPPMAPGARALPA